MTQPQTIFEKIFPEIWKLYDKPRNDFLIMRYRDMVAPLKNTDSFNFSYLSAALDGLECNADGVKRNYENIKHAFYYELHSNFVIIFLSCFDIDGALLAASNSLKHVHDDDIEELDSAIAILNLLGRLPELGKYIEKYKKVKQGDEYMDTLIPAVDLISKLNLAKEYEEVTLRMQKAIANLKAVSLKKLVEVTKDNLTGDDVIQTTFILKNAEYEQLRDVILASYDVIVGYEIENNADLDGLKFKFKREALA